MVALEGELDALRGEAAAIAAEMEAAARTRARRAAIERRVAELEDELRRASSAERPRLWLAERCPMRWHELTRVDDAPRAGHVDDASVDVDAVRFCGKCDQHVFDLRHMSEEEVSLFLWERTGQRTCGKVFSRPDGSVIGRDCTSASPRRTLAIFGGATVMVTAAALGLALHEAPTGHEVARTLPDSTLRPPPAPPPTSPEPDIDTILDGSTEALGELILEGAPIVVPDLSPIRGASNLAPTRRPLTVPKEKWITVGGLTLPAVPRADEALVPIAIDGDRPSRNLAELDAALAKLGIRDVAWNDPSASLKIEGSKVKFRLATGRAKTDRGPTKLAYALIQGGDARVFVALAGERLTQERVEAFFLPMLTEAHRLP